MIFHNSQTIFTVITKTNLHHFCTGLQCYNESVTLLFVMLKRQYYYSCTSLIWAELIAQEWKVSKKMQLHLPTNFTKCLWCKNEWCYNTTEYKWLPEELYLHLPVPNLIIPSQEVFLRYKWKFWLDISPDFGLPFKVN